MEAEYGPLDFMLIVDGKIHRFHVPGDRKGSDNGWYIFYHDGVPSGGFGDWKTGVHINWCAKQKLSYYEAEAQRLKVAEAKRQREQEQAERQSKAALNARDMWGRAHPAKSDHDYLKRKAIKPYFIRQQQDILIIPLIDIERKLVNVQRIWSDGTKRFLAGGRITGCFCQFGNIGPEVKIIICEGFATAATIREATGDTVLAAMNAGNLLPVARAIRKKYPAAEIIVAGDDDRRTEGNPGRTKANESALAVNGLVTFPEFCRPDCGCSDFNDVRCCRNSGGSR
ncbi:MAG: toprim domain-containing protein [Gammaproteobacteria bacterium]|nr:toprim domain-containing protein [Gammaproteobacteria bacterium]